MLILFFVWEWRHASGVTYSHWGPLGVQAGNDYDEGAYVVSAQLLLHGYSLFSQVFSAQPAFFLPSLAAVLHFASDPVVGGHVYEALSGILALGGVFWMAWTAYGPLAAPLAAALLGVTPGFLLYAHAVEAEMPMMALCTLSVAAAQSYYLTRRRVMAALAGLLLLAGSEMKLLSLVVIVPLALLLLGGGWQGYRSGRSWPALFGDAVAFVLSGLVPGALALLLLSPHDQLRQVVTFHLDASKVMAYNATANVQSLQIFLGYDWGLLLAAFAGLVLGLWFLPRRTRYLTMVYGLWFITTLAFLWRYHPLLQHQFVPLLPPLALLGAGTIVPLLQMARFLGLGRSPGREVRRAKPSEENLLHSPSQGKGTRGMATGAGAQRAVGSSIAVAVGAVYVVLCLVSTLPVDRHLFTPTVMPGRSALVAWLDAHTKPGDFVVADDPMVALDAHRLLAPGLEDPSMVRIFAGYLTDAEAEQSTQQYHVAAIVTSRPVGRKTVFEVLVPGYLPWIQTHYRELPSPAPATRVFVIQ